MVRVFWLLSLGVFLVTGLVAWVWPPFALSLLLTGPLFLVGVLDSLQTKHAVRRNFPVIGNLRYLLEMIRPEINQYFIESNTDGTPFNREQRSIAYQRAKATLDKLPFGTQRDVYAVGTEWINHSLSAVSPEGPAPRIRIGGPRCTRPYDAALLNVSAMSFGSLSGPAIEALNHGAALGGFSHNTGEGGLSPHHQAGGGDLVWQLGTAYFGCRTPDGGFDAEAFAAKAASDQVKMIEVKLSQGAKPGHGGILPAAKITPEVAAIRHVPMGKDVVSPPTHRAFDSPRSMLAFLDRLRELSGGKPVGIKFCVGDPVEVLGICRAMYETGQGPDFMTVDGSEGGTGAAPLEFSNSIGWPLTEGLVFVHNALMGYGLRERVKIIAAGKIITGFDMAKRLAQGADLCNAARGMMFALGCIQARRCHQNDCPVGVATQKPSLVRGLVVEHKAVRVRNFQHHTVEAFREILGAAGLTHPDDLRPRHIVRRTGPQTVQTYAEIHEYLRPGQLLDGPIPAYWRTLLDRTRVGAFERGPRPARAVEGD